LHSGCCLDTLACKCGLRFGEVECFGKGLSERQSIIVVAKVVEKNLGLSGLETNQSQSIVVLGDKDRSKFVRNVDVQLHNVV